MVSMSADTGRPHIRPGNAADIADVLAMLDGAAQWLLARGLTEQWGPDSQSANPHRIALISDAAANGGLHLAVIGDEVVGALVVGAAPDDVPPVHESELFVRLLVTHRSYGGRGIGRLLLDRAREIAVTAGRALLRVDCYAGADQELVRYYEKQGFTATDRFELPRAVGTWPGQVLQQRLT